LSHWILGSGKAACRAAMTREPGDLPVAVVLRPAGVRRANGSTRVATTVQGRARAWVPAGSCARVRLPVVRSLDGSLSSIRGARPNEVRSVLHSRPAGRSVGPYGPGPASGCARRGQRRGLQRRSRCGGHRQSRPHRCDCGGPGRHRHRPRRHRGQPGHPHPRSAGPHRRRHPVAQWGTWRRNGSADSWG